MVDREAERVLDPGTSLRTPTLRPNILDEVEHGFVTSDARKWRDAIREIWWKRRNHPAKWSNGPGRLLTYAPGANLADGAAKKASHGFFDDNNMPPWDTWVHFDDGRLYAWIPPAMEALAQAGMDVNAEECIWWTDSAPASSEIRPRRRSVEEAALAMLGMIVRCQHGAYYAPNLLFASRAPDW